MRSAVAVLVFTLALLCGCAGNPDPNSATAADPAAPQPPAVVASESEPEPVSGVDVWPREVRSGSDLLTLYSPQVEAWSGDRLSFRCALSVRQVDGKQETFGVIWISAHTLVDREQRLVTLTDFELARMSFPSLPDGGEAHRKDLAQELPDAARTISLDRIETSLAAGGGALAKGLPVANPVPRIYTSETPAILIPIAGKPEFRRVPDHEVERVLNTRAAILRVVGTSVMYLHIYDGWLTAESRFGPWTRAAAPPTSIEQAAAHLARQGAVDMLDGGSEEPRPTLDDGIPAVVVRTNPAELLVFRGAPEYAPVAGTGLAFATNTTADVVVEAKTNQHYVLLSGRWYRAPSLKGPWKYVPSRELPPAFARIPSSSPAGRVLATIAGTSQAREALIANSVPQTATIPLDDPPKFQSSFDGAPELRPIEGTSLHYAANSVEPVIRVAPDSWYAVSSGAWFRSDRANGPWEVARSVPKALYSISLRSPMHRVTYVQVYRTTPDLVFAGYTPGYLGTVVNLEGVVVYGTGYEYPAWVGTAYQPAPSTWGAAAQPVYNPTTGWTYGYNSTLYGASVYGSSYYYTVYRHPYACCATTSANVYGTVGNVSYSGSSQAYANSSSYGVSGSGSWSNQATGTTGTYETNRDYNYDSNTGSRSASGTYETQSGRSGEFDRNASYDYDSGRYSASGSGSTETKSGGELERSATVEGGGSESPSVERSASYTNPEGATRSTGSESRSASSAASQERYGGADGNVYQRESSGGWQKAGSNGWKPAGGNNGWAEREERARRQASSRSAARSSAGGGYGRGASGGGFSRGGGGGFRGGGRR